MGEIQRYQRCLRGEFTVREDRFSGLRVALLECQARAARLQIQGPQMALT